MNQYFYIIKQHIIDQETSFVKTDVSTITQKASLLLNFLNFCKHENVSFCQFRQYFHSDLFFLDNIRNLYLFEIKNNSTLNKQFFSIITNFYTDFEIKLFFSYEKQPFLIILDEFGYYFKLEPP